MLARVDRKYAEASHILDEYLSTNPKNTFALHLRCSEEWERQDWAAAEKSNRKLLDLDPNWVLAYNQLGYIAMAQGRFAEAQKDFEAYRFIAPDQANPHDSLGELLTLTGRYDDAQKELEDALKVRPDFCPAYEHIVGAALLAGDQAKAEEALTRASKVAACGGSMLTGLRCSIAIWKEVLSGTWEGAWKAAEDGCLDVSPGDIPILAHRAAVLTGRTAQALDIEAKFRKYLTSARPAGEPLPAIGQAALLNMEAERQLAAGKVQDAVDGFRKADEKLSYNGSGEGVFKLYDQLCLADALRAAGNDPQAAEVLERVKKVNPRFAQAFAGANLPRPAA
jgi:tetratricopeptide (TPR) repeat protein